MGRKPKNVIDATADWVIAHDGTKGDKAYALECLRCGGLQKVTLPIPVTCYTAFARRFINKHGRCPAS